MDKRQTFYKRANALILIRWLEKGLPFKARIWHSGTVPSLERQVENPTIRISPNSKAMLLELAKQEGKPVQTVLDEAIEERRRELFFNQLDEDFARLQADPVAWAEYQKESRSWHEMADFVDEK